MNEVRLRERIDRHDVPLLVIRRLSKRKREITKRRNTMKEWIRNAGMKWVFPLLFAFLFLPAIGAKADAEATYKAKCAGCHGADGVGSTAAGKAMKVRDFHSPEVQKETDAELTDIIANGKNKMPKFSDKLKDTEIKELVGYVRGLGKK
jgi:cytochrome c553